MKYTDHIKSISEISPELDLLKESEFHLFKNEIFAISSTNYCIELANHVSDKLGINLYFSIEFNQTFNAKAIVKDKFGIILFNLGLIEKLESIISQSIDIFSTENIAQLTVSTNEKPELKNLFIKLCLTYLFYHEFAHVLQLSNSTSFKTYNFQEKYSDNKSFKIKNHIYELDADHFGVSMSTITLLEYIRRANNTVNTMLLFNLLTALLFSISNIIIEFSENKFETIYYKKYSHPHPLIRIMECNEQILFLVSNNLVINKEFFIVVLQRTITMIDQLYYKSKGHINLSKLVDNNINEIDFYDKEIEVLNESYKELVRFKIESILKYLLENYPYLTKSSSVS